MEHHNISQTKHQQLTNLKRSYLIKAKEKLDKALEIELENERLEAKIEQFPYYPNQYHY